MQIEKVQLLLLFFFYSETFAVDEVCPQTDKENIKKTYYRYILYDVNPPEGFNLRRDVYMRLAVFVANLKHHKNTKSMQNFKNSFYHLGLNCSIGIAMKTICTFLGRGFLI